MYLCLCARTSWCCALQSRAGSLFGVHLVKIDVVHNGRQHRCEGWKQITHKNRIVFLCTNNKHNTRTHWITKSDWIRSSWIINEFVRAHARQSIGIADTRDDQSHEPCIQMCSNRSNQEIVGRALAKWARSIENESFDEKWIDENR